MKTIGAVIEVPSMRAEMAAKPRRTSARIASCQHGRSFREGRPGVPRCCTSGMPRWPSTRALVQALLADQSQGSTRFGPTARRGLGQLGLGRRGGLDVPFPASGDRDPGRRARAGAATAGSGTPRCRFRSAVRRRAERTLPLAVFWSPLLAGRGAPPTWSTRAARGQELGEGPTLAPTRVPSTTDARRRPARRSDTSSGHAPGRVSRNERVVHLLDLSISTARRSDAFSRTRSGATRST